MFKLDLREELEEQNINQYFGFPDNTVTLAIQDKINEMIDEIERLSDRIDAINKGTSQDNDYH